MFGKWINGILEGEMNASQYTFDSQEIDEHELDDAEMSQTPPAELTKTVSDDS